MERQVISRILLECELASVIARVESARASVASGERLDYALLRRELFDAGKRLYGLYEELILTPEHELQEP